MNLDQTKCDHCGKVHNTPERRLPVPDKHSLMIVLLQVDGVMKHLDFCDEDCLREELIKRKKDKEFKYSTQDYPACELKSSL